VGTLSRHQYVEKTIPIAENTRVLLNIFPWTIHMYINPWFCYSSSLTDWVYAFTWNRKH
jgi:hypothetical protein